MNEGNGQYFCTYQLQYKLFHQASYQNNNLITLDVKHLSTISNFAFPMIFESKSAFIKYRDAFLKNKVEQKRLSILLDSFRQ